MAFISTCSSHPWAEDCLEATNGYKALKRMAPLFLAPLHHWSAWGKKNLRSLNQGKKEHANLQQTELLRSGGFANHSLSHLWFFWPKSCIAQYLGGPSESKQLILPSGSKFILRSFGNTVQKYPDRLISGIFLPSVSISRKITLSVLHVL